eukprot:COSAG03_NODE_13059_length_518_cov_1.085919_2_plen_71_part_00
MRSELWKLILAAPHSKPVQAASCHLTTHEPGVAIYMPHPMNDHFTHGIPERKRVDECRISLTFREIAPVS